MKKLDERKAFNILWEMCRNRKKNNGQPIVAAVFKTDEYHSPVVIESNKRLRKKHDEDGIEIYENDQHLGHAEWLCMDFLNSKGINGVGYKIYITSSPCDECARRIINEFNFDYVFYLFDKHTNTNNLFKSYSVIKKYNPNPTSKEFDILDKMQKHWIDSNKTNKEKTKLKR